MCDLTWNASLIVWYCFVLGGFPLGFGINANRQAYLDGGGSYDWGYGAVVRACAAVGRLDLYGEV